MPETRRQFDVVVVGAGPAGLSAAAVAAESGKRVGLVSDAPWRGGQIWHHHESEPPEVSAAVWLGRAGHPKAAWSPATTVIDAPAPGLLLAEQAGGPVELAYDQLILATGARELFLPFPGWTLPGVLGPGGLQALSKSGWPVAGKRVVIAGSGPLLLAAADGLKRRGADVLWVIEQAPFPSVAKFGAGLWRHPSKLLQAAQIRWQLAGTRFLYGGWVTRAEGKERISRVMVSNGARAWEIRCDVLACAYGLVPNTELAQLLGCDLENGFVRVDTQQRTSLPNVYAAGELTAIGGADRALVEGQIAGLTAAGKREAARELWPERERWQRFARNMAAAFRLRPELLKLASAETLVCRCEDVTLGRLAGFQSWREAKLHTRCGMGPCQGRVCGPALRELLGWGAESVRPPLFPSRVETLGAACGERG